MLMRMQSGCLRWPIVFSVVLGLLAEPAGSTASMERGARPGREYISRVSTRERLAVRREGAIPTLATTPSPARAALAPIDELEFDGIRGNEVISPSDTVGAAGATRVVTAVNVRYAVYDKTGTTLLGPASIKALFPGLPGAAFVFDPKVVYDHYRGRFVLVALAGRFGFRPRAWILIAAIPDANAVDRSTWCRRKVKADQVRGFGKLWGDYPGLGFDRERIYITTNQFTFDSQRFRYVQILALRKSGLYDCDKPLRKKVFARGKTRDPQGTPGFTIQPAITETEMGRDPTEFLLSFQDTELCGPSRLPCGRRLTVWRISETRQGLRLRKRSVGVGLQIIAPLGTQRGGDDDCADLTTCWDTGDLRLINAFYDADRGLLYGAHAVTNPDAPDAYLESVIRWYEVDVTPWKATTISRKGLIAQDGRDAGWPVIATDGPGNVLITYSRAGAPGIGEYLSAYGASVGPGSITPGVQVLRNGEATYIETRNFDVQRWGDYNGISRDPIDPSDVWMVNQIAADDGEGPAAETDLWLQVVHRVSEAP
jgi:hypothetical protein